MKFANENSLRREPCVKVLHYVKQFSPLSETFVYNQIIDLQVKGILNSVVTHKRLNAETRPYDGTIYELQEDQSFFQREIRRFLRKKGLHKYALSFVLWEKILEEVSPDLIHCHFGKSGFYISHILEKLGGDIPLLISFHGTDVLKTPTQDKWYRRGISKISKNPKILFTTPTIFLKDAAIKNFGIDPIKIFVNPNGFHDAFGEFYRKKPLDRDTCYKIINVARFVKWKGQNYLIQAFGDFVNNVTPNAKLTLVGYGECKSKLLSLIEDLDLQSKIEILESVPHSDIPEILRDHNLYVQPSITDTKTKQAESFGVTILEAVAIGLPVIVTDSGGMKEVILGGDNASARVVKEKDSKALFEAMSAIYRETRNLDSGLRDRILSRFNQSNNSSTILEIYKELCD